MKMYTYKIRFYDEDKREVVPGTGIVAANSYGQAADKVVDYYGKNDFICFDDLSDQGDLLTIEDINEMGWF